MGYFVTLPTIKFASFSINFPIMFYFLIKSYINLELSLALNVPSVIYMMKRHCIYFMIVFVYKMYGINLDYIFQKTDLSVLTPQGTIFGVVDVQGQNTSCLIIYF